MHVKAIFSFFLLIQYSYVIFNMTYVFQNSHVWCIEYGKRFNTSPILLIYMLHIRVEYELYKYMFIPT